MRSIQVWKLSTEKWISQTYNNARHTGGLGVTSELSLAHKIEGMSCMK